MDWKLILVPAIEALLFILPLFKIVYDGGKKQQSLEDNINHIGERLDKVEQKHENTLITVSGIQSCIARIEVKLDLVMSSFTNNKEQING